MYIYMYMYIYVYIYIILHDITCINMILCMYMHVIYTKYGISLKIASSVRNTMINNWIVVDSIFGP